MELKDLLGTAYKEGMTIDEINAAIKDKTFVDGSRLTDTVSKSMFDKTASELAEHKKQLKALKETTMTDEEKHKQAMAELEAQKKEFAKKLSKLEVEKTLVSGGLTENEYKDFIDGIVTEDSEISSNLAKGIVKALTAQKAATEAKIKRDLLNSTPTPEGQNPGGIANNAKEIEAALQSGDTALAASIIRQNAQSSIKI